MENIEFIESIGAKRIRDHAYEKTLSDLENSWNSHPKFRKDNYFLIELNGEIIILIVKMSRTKIPFWGVGKQFIEFFNNLNSTRYFLILLDSNKSGWFYSSQDIEKEISSNRWSFSKTDFKINYGDLSGITRFLSPDSFLSKIKEHLAIS